MAKAKVKSKDPHKAYFEANTFCGEATWTRGSEAYSNGLFAIERVRVTTYYTRKFSKNKPDGITRAYVIELDKGMAEGCRWNQGKPVYLTEEHAVGLRGLLPTVAEVREL